MTLDHYPLGQFKSDILHTAAKYLDLSTTKIFIFGSRATTKGDDRSDIDLGLEPTQHINAQSLTSFKEAIENLNTLYIVDVVDFSQVSNSFAKTASENKIYLN